MKPPKATPRFQTRRNRSKAASSILAGSQPTPCSWGLLPIHAGRTRFSSRRLWLQIPRITRLPHSRRCGSMQHRRTRRSPGTVRKPLKAGRTSVAFLFQQIWIRDRFDISHQDTELSGYICVNRFRLTAARHSKRGWSRGCVGTETRYCRGPAGVQRCASPIAAIHGDFQSAAERTKTAQDQVSGTFMPQKVRIALDAMGGDVGAAVVIPGAAISLTRHPDTEFLLFGERSLIEAQLAKHPAMKAVSRVIHTDVAVGMNDKPSQALRRGRKTSPLWLAIDAVQQGKAAVAVSAGNTGALMAMARFCLRTLPGIDRPAIAAVWPTARGDSIVLDLGATIGGDARHLVALSVMGAAMASVLFELERPTVGLLNIGVEEIKGHEEIREAAELLRA